MPCSWAATSRGWWPVAGHLCIQGSDRRAVLKEEPNGSAKPKRVQLCDMRSSPGKTGDESEEPCTGDRHALWVMPGDKLAGLIPVTSDSREAACRAWCTRWPEFCAPKPQTPFRPFEPLRGTGYRMQSNRRSVAVQSHSAWWVCSDQCGVPARCRPAFSGVSMGPGAAPSPGRGAATVRTPLPR